MGESVQLMIWYYFYYHHHYCYCCNNYHHYYYLFHDGIDVSPGYYVLCKAEANIHPRPIHNGRLKKICKWPSDCDPKSVLGIFSYYDLEVHNGWHEGNVQVTKSSYLQNIIPICVAEKMAPKMGTWLGHNIEVPHGFLYAIHHTSYIMG
jgi:hypothetical protein